MAGTRPSVERIPVATRTSLHERTNAYVVGDSAGLLVDPAATDAMLTAAVESRDIAHVAITHAHPDHVGAVAHYASRCGATVWARAGRTDRFASATGRTPDRTFTEGSRVGPASVIETPGHAPDHVSFRVGREAVIGDLAVANGSIYVGGDDGDLRAYLVSLRRLRHAGLERLYPGHGPVIDDVNGALDRLLAHRKRRERRILEAVGNGARTVAAVTDAAYDKDLAGVVELARLTVVAHLDKLAVEGRIEWDGKHASPA